MNTRFLRPRALPRMLAVLALAVVPTVLASGAARADEDTARREAQKRLEEAIRLHDEGKDEEARAKFVQAWAILKTPNVLFNLARTEQLSKHEVDAIRHYRHYLRMGDPRITDNDRNQVRAYIEQLAPSLGHMRIVAPPGSVLFVDGTRVDVPVGEIVDVVAGKHTVTAKIRGKDKHLPVECPPGTEITATIPDEGGGVSPPPPPPPPGGDTATTKHTTLFPPPTGALAVGIAGVAAIGVGIGFGADASSKSSDVSNQRGTHPPPCFVSTSSGCSNFKSAVTSAQQSATIADALFIGGGVALAGAIVWWLVAPREETGPTKGMWVAPAIGATDLGVRAVGRF